MSDLNTTKDLRDALDEVGDSLSLYCQLVAHDRSAWTVSLKCAEYLDAITNDGVFLIQFTHRNLDTLQDGSVPHECAWRYDFHGDAWDTGCGEKFWFASNGPEENGFEYCPYCGGTLNALATNETE